MARDCLSGSGFCGQSLNSFCLESGEESKPMKIKLIYIPVGIVLLVLLARSCDLDDRKVTLKEQLQASINDDRNILSEYDQVIKFANDNKFGYKVVRFNAERNGQKYAGAGILVYNSRNVPCDSCSESRR